MTYPTGQIIVAAGPIPDTLLILFGVPLACFVAATILFILLKRFG